VKRILLTMCALGATVALADPAFARKSRQFDGIAKGPHGREAMISRNIERGDGQRSVRSSITGKNGKTATSETSRVIDREAGIAERSKIVTGPEGNTRSVDVTATKTGEGQYDLNREVTGFNGDTRTQTGSGSITKTDTGYSSSGSLTSEKGTTTFDRSATREDGVRTVSGTATGPGGAVRTLDRERDYNAGTYDSTRTLTSADGKTRSVETEAVRDGNAVEGSKTVTGPQGNTRTTTFSGAVTPAN
jgi:hypothetical protein